MNNLFGPGFSGFMDQKQMMAQQDQDYFKQLAMQIGVLNAQEEMKDRVSAREAALRKQRALQALVAASQPQALGPQAMAEGALSGDIGPTVTNAARLEALQRNPVAGQYTPIPPQLLAQAHASGVNIEPFLKLNAESRPDVMTVDLGDKIRTIDKKTLRVISETPKGAAPGSRPFEASDLTPKEYRNFQTGKAAAGAPKLGPGLSNKVSDIASEGRAAAAGASDIVNTVGRVNAALASGNVNLGPGSTILNKADQVAQILGVGGASTPERLVNTRNVMRGLAQFTVGARKALKGQGQVSDYEGKLLTRAESGEIQDFTIPELKDFLKVTESIARKAHAEHKRVVGIMAKSPDAEVRGLVPYFDIPDLPTAPAATDEAPKPKVRKYNPATGRIE